MDRGLEQAGYQRYDPFPGGIGTPSGLTSFIKLFVAPVQSGWVRVLGMPDLALMADIRYRDTVLHAWLDETDSGITVLNDDPANLESLAAFLRTGKMLADLERIQRGNMPIAVERPNESLLPDDIQQLAHNHGVNPDQAGKLINRLTSQMFGKLDRSSAGEASTMQSQAHALASGGGQVNWNSPAAQRLKAIMNLLTVPDNWRDPSFEDVREAYQVARRLVKTPGARLMPDEQAALNAVPNAIDYIPIYVGK